MRRRLALLLILLAWPSGALALSGSGTTAATFLKIAVGPRAAAMGEAYAAAAEDATAVYWNPAGLSRLAGPEYTAMHVFWLQDIAFEHLGAALPLASGVLGASLTYLNNGTLLRSETGDQPGSPDRGTFSSADWSFAGAYGLEVDRSLSLGGGVKLFSENIDSQASFGWALDLAFRYRLPWDGWNLGGVVQNLGPATRVQEAYARLPINFKLGLAYAPAANVLVTLDYNQLLEQDPRISLGAEYVFEEILALRAGYRYQSAVDNMEYYEGFGSSALSGLSAGLGLRYEDFRVDYAFVPYGFLGSTHRIGLTYAPEPAIQAETTKSPAPAPTPAPAGL